MTETKQKTKPKKLSFFKRRKHMKINVKAYKKIEKLEKIFNKLYEEIYNYSLGKNNKAKIDKLKVKLENQLKKSTKISKLSKITPKLHYEFYSEFVEKVSKELQDNMENKQDLIENMMELKKELLTEQTKFFKIIQRYI